MSKSSHAKFSANVAKKLRYYVYRLIDPRNGETFYVGKGKGNRMFAHVHAEEKKLDGDEFSNKLKRIRDIHLAGLDVGHVVHRHGMDESTAIEVEAALIDAYPGLTNIAGGVDSGDFGVMHAEEIRQRYDAKPAVFRHKVLLINVGRSSEKRDLYHATRYAWKISKPRAEQADYVLATRQGLIVGAFVADKWMRATRANFPDRAEGEGEPDRWGFQGKSAPDLIWRQYVGKRIPDQYRKRGAANPIKYV